MKNITKLAVVCMVLGLAACSKPQGAGGINDPYANGMGGAGAGGVGTGVIGAPGSPEYFRSTVGDTIHFMLDQSTLSPDARTTLANQASWLNQNPNYSAVIEGHADEQGTREYNIALGARRANSVQEYLISQGVQAGRLRTVSYGKERPLAICSTEDCYTKNRRAVTVVKPRAGS
ncbi:peptidoglycan-associated lipoprotein Pal [Paracoccus aminophilus]|uniref:Peptidoglycan-associated lipoprotein n=1 Tax=Paracoccus aminophilus JCM 7686 TaxID=1367847 RepID=S5XW36_PARAH|nr:peptidoglycan-associated lipoprotein Pal [Paracoccus aminophilus]AGT07585.1 OmpA domain-containing protein [Paracoccus aminophilus JCM 7686]